MQLNDPRDSFYTDKQTALTEHKRILRLGGKAHCRRYNLNGKAIYRVRVQKKPA